MKLTRAGSEDQTWDQLAISTFRKCLDYLGMYFPSNTTCYLS